MREYPTTKRLKVTMFQSYLLASYVLTKSSSYSASESLRVIFAMLRANDALKRHLHCFFCHRSEKNPAARQPTRAPRTLTVQCN